MIQRIVTSVARVPWVRSTAALVPFNLRFGLAYRHWRRLIRTSEEATEEEIAKWQLSRLRRVVTHAYRYTDGYRQLYDEAGVSPHDVRRLDDLSSLPFVTKELLRDNLSAFSVRHDSSVYLTTGGSTGIPFGFYLRRRDIAIEQAFIHESWRRAGWRLGDWTAVLRGAYIGSELEPFWVDRYRRQLFLSSYYLTGRTVRAYLETAQKRGTRILEAYPSALQLLMNLAEEEGLQALWPFQLVLLGSENIYEWQVANVRRFAPQMRIFSWYGQAEQVVLAPWCEQRQAYHVWPYYGLAEIVDERGRPVDQGVVGEIIGTSLRVRPTPFIRYRTSDRATRGLSKCELCGRPFPLLERIDGRLHEVIVTGRGRYISIAMMNFHDDVFDGLRQFQFVQQERGVVRFRYVPKLPLNETAIQRISQKLQTKLGRDVQLVMEATDAIPRTPSGKLRFLDQSLNIAYTDPDAH